MELLAGDIVFFKTDKDGSGPVATAPNSAKSGSFNSLDAADFGDFPVAGGFGQSYPYHVVQGRYLPWHHTAVATGQTQLVAVDGDWTKGLKRQVELIGFNTGYDDPANANAIAFARHWFDLRGFEWGPAVTGTIHPGSVDILRHSNAGVAELIAGKSVALADGKAVRYSFVGLLALAHAMAGWMQPAGAVRAAYLAYAKGLDQAERAIGKDDETCTTAISAVVEESIAEVLGTTKLSVNEPPVPPRSFVDLRVLARSVALKIRFNSLASKLIGTEPFVVEPVVAEGVLTGVTLGVQISSDLDATEARVRQLLATDIAEREGDRLSVFVRLNYEAEDLFGPGHELDQVFVERVLDDVISQLGGLDPDRGVPHDTSIGSGSLLVSPAMLFDSLIDAGFQHI